MRKLRLTGYFRWGIGWIIRGLPKMVTAVGTYIIENAEVAYDPKSTDIVIRIKRER